MKISLQLKLGQQLTMTPQLQQAIRLLQLSTLDLQQEVHQALESNPMLELDESHSDDGEYAAGSAREQDAGSSDQKSSQESNDPVSTNTFDDTSSFETTSFETTSVDSAESYSKDQHSATDSVTAGQDADTRQQRDTLGEGTSDDYSTADSSWEDSIPEQLSVDTSWDDIYQNSYSTGSPAPASDSDFESRDSAAESLQDHLLWQLNVTKLSETDRLIGVAIIDAVDVNGRLSVSVESILSGLQDYLDVDEEEVLAVLHRIQLFDPVGVAYRDLSDCLTIQLEQVLDEDAPDSVRHALLLAKNHLPLLGSRDYTQIMRLTRLKEAELSAAIKVIEALNPRPGADIAPSNATYIVPDVFVSKDSRSGRWKVELNPETTPRLRINADYAALVRRADSTADNTYLRDNLQEARWFLKSLQSRAETLLKVASRIVEYQQDFLEQGEEGMKPLVLHDIAEAVSMHESTISRVTTQKYMHTPRGIFELKYFFSSHVGTAAGGEFSSTAIRALIKKMVAAETPRKPLSDSKIAKMLEEQGINVARRTIAKYRESLNIPPSNERKRLT